MALTFAMCKINRDRQFSLWAKRVARWAVYLGEIGAVMWPVSLLINLSTWDAGDRVIRALLVDQHVRPWLLASYAGAWLGSIGLLFSGKAFLRDSKAGRYGLIGCTVAVVVACIGSVVFNLTYMPAVLASLRPPAPAWQRLQADPAANLASLIPMLAGAGLVIWLLTRPAVVRSERSDTPS